MSVMNSITAKVHFHSLEFETNNFQSQIPFRSTVCTGWILSCLTNISAQNCLPRSGCWSDNVVLERAGCLHSGVAYVFNGVLQEKIAWETEGF